MRTRLTGIGIDNLRLPTTTTGETLLGDALHQFNFPPRGTVKVAPQTGEGAHDGRIGVAFDCVEGYDAGKGGSPAGELGADYAQVDDVEGVFDCVVDSRFEDGLWINKG